ncbi:hypothetical protein GCM10025882_06630 [Acinetobacter gyllenbergii]|uniref:Sel1 repeat family protein n=1 Tax=Acinetobacter gyllenbergii CIP 110306 = MTCC 11365 TaxID=1217657 RepID=A0A829HL63_9GAMM|nr:SEL1-like repeat protein [Acinetobacter gyllenbergii]EPF93019.1 hypothetical protein F957_00361 [Acinetobacter gyllenbergii CIP 110306 = MTCC 11365]EPH31329.1 hypothetical protein L293_2144 [Acinetobacter gyllenbergii CIP 110306 = MTCC 11365]ESK37042.1 hypothetical protein F987_03504 [Acinetobacter gyllenbergii NIPH 230]MCU4579640.1 SEL1-like repeat protein [Acinetobacter gyllenbergii]OBY74220.1 Sel1 repeat protein [Acinetobacter gyllenbergii]
MNINIVKQQLRSCFLSFRNNDLLSESKQEISKAQFFENLAINEHIKEDHYTISSNDRNAVWYFLRAALRGNADAAFKLGESYLHGEFGLDKNYGKAQYWLERAAHLGHPEAKGYLYSAFSELAFS